MIGSRQLLQLGRCLSKAQLKFYQTTMASLLVPPPSVRGIKKLDSDAFQVKLENVPCLHLPYHTFNKHKSTIKQVLLKLPKFKPVQASEVKEEGKCTIYLDKSRIQDISDDLKEKLLWDQIYQEKELQLSYENWTHNEVLRAILPEDIEVPTSYSIIGHIIHMNLRDEQLPYKTVIGQVFLDKIPNIKTVVNKLNTIDSTYRNFAMEILAGEEDTVVTVKEHGITYHFDFAKVYWNPRLSTEHQTLVEFLKPDDVLYDVFAGVGPFSVPAARKKVRVLANDLNPESYRWLLRNADVNKVQKRLTAFNKDGRDFLREEVKSDILERRATNAPGSEHIAMNLPALAVEFLDVFADWLSVSEIDEVTSRPPTVHCYCFVKAGKNEDYGALAKQLVEDNLGAKLDVNDVADVRHVRNVAPSKEMMRVSFRLTRELLRIEVMGKKNKAKAKNVFKVAGARCQKAKKVKSSLKKLDLGQGGKLNKEKTNLINKQLAEIGKEVHQSAGKKNKPKKASSGPIVKSAAKVSEASKQQAANLIQELKL